jgi:hypothetical protein
MTRQHFILNAAAAATDARASKQIEPVDSCGLENE